MRRAVVLGVVALALVLSGCGDDAPSDYNAEVEENRKEHVFVVYERFRVNGDAVPPRRPRCTWPTGK